MDFVGDLFQKVLSIGPDVLVIAVTIGVLTAYGFFWGKEKIVSLILGLYAGAFLFQYAPFGGEGLWSQIGVLAILTAISTFLFEKLVVSDFSYSKFKKFTSALILGTGGTTLLLVFSYHVIDIQALYNFGGGIDALFSAKLLFWWLLGPLVALFVTSR